MDQSHARPTSNATVWLFVAFACGAVFIFLMLFLSSRPASALDLPPVGSVVQDPVGTVTNTVADAGSTKPPGQSAAPAAPQQTAPQRTAPASSNADVVAKATGALPGVANEVVGNVTDAVPRAASQVLAPVAAAVSPVTDELVAPVLERAVAPVAGIVDDVTPPLGGALAPVTKVIDDVTSPPPSAPSVPHLGGAARRLTAPTVAPLPLNSDPPSPAGPPLPIPATGTDQFGSGIGTAGVTRAPGARTATALPAPRDHFPFDMPADAPTPAAPRAPAGTSGPADGGSRAPTLLCNFAIVLAAAALALVASRLIALYQTLPRTQFLTVLIERPG